MIKKTLSIIFLLSSLVLASPGEGRLGVFLQRLDSDLAESLKYRGDGVVVQKVIEDGGADRAGIEVGDIIVTVNGKQVLNNRDVLVALDASAPGEEAKVHVIRKGEPLDFVVSLSGPEVFPVQQNKWIVIHEEGP
ncbi:MAG: PDZ domain-containing protein, partial [Acidobacteria bacterium]|nr:PDZ domain-containing protein [Acidobacteriota bacterium]